MFVPPEQRLPRLPPLEPAPPGRKLTRREKAVVMGLVGFFVVSMVLAPIGGSSLVEALWYVLRR